MAFYVASKSKHGPMWQDYRARGVPIVARWIDVWDGGTFTDADGAEHWRKIREDIAACDVLVVYSEPGEIQKGALVEMGIAMGKDKKVIAVSEERIVTAV